MKQFLFIPTLSLCLWGSLSAEISDNHINLSGSHTFLSSAQNTATFFWQPSKYAFRAGRAMNNTNFHSANLGMYSFGSGYNARASGFSSTAIGFNPFASGYCSFAQGYFPYASGSFSVSMGNFTYASGYGSIAMGLAWDDEDLVETSALSYGAIAIGTGATASSTGAISIGTLTSASADYAVALGRYNRAIGVSSFAVGYNSEAEYGYSGAMGFMSEARATTAFAIGSNLIVRSRNATAVGFNNDPMGTTNNSNATDRPIFMVGNGDSSYNFRPQKRVYGSRQWRRNYEQGAGRYSYGGIRVNPFRSCQIRKVLCFLCLFSTSLSALNINDIVNESEDIDNGWYYSEWFGYFEVLTSTAGCSTGLIYHNEHGALCVGNVSGSYYEFYDWSIGGAMEVDPTSYPSGISIFGAGNFSYVKGSSPERWFFDHINDHWVYYWAHLEHKLNGPNGPIPLWWKYYNMVDLSRVVSNHSPLLTGQLKHISTQAKVYLDAQLGLVDEIWDLAYAGFGGNPFPLPVGTTEGNHGMANLGQLKYLSSGFYEILNHVNGYDVKAYLSSMMGGTPAYWITGTPGYPWAPSTPVAENRKPSNIGQLKLVYSFSLEGVNNPFVDFNGNSIDDVWEYFWFNSFVSDVHIDYDGDGQSILEEFLSGTNPHEKDHPDVGLVVFEIH